MSGRFKRTMRVIETAVLLTMVAGCGASRPVRYYTLERPPASEAPAAGTYPVSLLVGRIRSTRLLEDDRIVYGMSDVEMGVYNEHRWAEPPAEMIETMLVERLRSTGEYKSIERLAGATRGNYVVRGRLISLEEVDLPSGIVARFSMELELFRPETGTVVWTEAYSHDEPVRKKTVNDVVEAQQRNVETGLTQLTAGLGQYFASQTAK